jgi:PLP dependent protein
MSIEELKNNYNKVQVKISEAAIRSNRDPDDIQIVAVTKTHPLEMIMDSMKAGISVFGENYAQELRDKIRYFDEKGINQPEWHYIGHLQRNKVKYLFPIVKMIHSVDSVKLAEEILKQAQKNNRKVEILLQVNTSGEASKFGCEPNETEDLLVKTMDLATDKSGQENMKICGLMTIGSFSEDEKIYRKEFTILRELRDELQTKYKEISLRHLSMGMTNDFEAAVEEGATIVRIGTAIFGPRECKISR